VSFALQINHVIKKEIVMTQKSKVAIIGLGNIGTVVATNLVKGNRPVIVADRTFEKANSLSQKLGNLAQPAAIAAAVKEAEIIVLAIWFDGIKEFFKTYATELQGKIIVDPSNPIAPDEKGGFKKIVDKNQSAGQILSALLPKNVKLAKALGTLGAASLEKAAFQQPEKAVEFYATDDTSVNGQIEDLIHDNGFEPVRIGGLNQSIRIEVFGDLHEFGALGKTVTLSEVKQVGEPA
jgi:8-hydroxy-5-deazaflavin:NADPH oxidoreductase